MPKTLDIPESLKTPLAEPGAPQKRRQAPPAGRPIGLDDDEARVLATKLKSYYEQSKSDREALECERRHDHTGQEENRIQSYEREFRAMERPDAKGWPISDAKGNPRSANFRIPVLHAVGSAEVANLAASTFATKPYLLIDPERDEDEERARALEAWYSNLHETTDYPGAVAEMLSRQVFEGVGILHVPYREDREWTVTRPAQVEIPGAPLTDGEGQPIMDEETGEPVMGDPFFETVQEMGWEVRDEGPRAEVVRRDRFHLYPSSAFWINGPRKAWAVFYSYDLGRNDLVMGRHDGRWDISDEAWSRFQAPPERTDGSGDADKDADDIARHEALSYTAVDCYCGYDVEGDGIEIPCLFTFLVETGDLIRARVAPLGGVRPFAQFYSRDPNGVFEGVSTAQLLEGLCAGINQFVNGAADTSTLKILLANTPFLSDAAGLDPDDLVLGGPCPVHTDKNGMWWATPPTDSDSMPLVDFFWAMVERITGISAANMGVPTPSQRTATEIATVSNAGSRLFDHRVRLLDAGHRQVADITAWQMYLNGPDHLEFKARLSDKQLVALQQQAEMDQRAEQAVYEIQMAAYQQAFTMWSQLAVLPPMPGMPPVGDPPAPPEPPRAPSLQEYAPTELTAQDFDPRNFKVAINGSAGALNREQRAAEAQAFYATMQTNPFVMTDANRMHKLTAIYVNSFQTLPFNSPEEIIGPEPPPGMPVPMPLPPMGLLGPPSGEKPQDGAPGAKERGLEKKDGRPDNSPVGDGPPPMPPMGGVMG